MKIRQNSSPCGNEKCKTVNTPLWRKGWSAHGKTVMLCNACGLHYKKGHFCTYCNQIYREADAEDKENPWITCERCSRWIHQKCEEKHGFAITEDQSYFCPECRNLLNQLGTASNQQQAIENLPASFKKRRKRPSIKTNSANETNKKKRRRTADKAVVSSSSSASPTEDSNSTVPQLDQFSTQLMSTLFMSTIQHPIRPSLLTTPSTVTSSMPSTNLFSDTIRRLQQPCTSTHILSTSILSSSSSFLPGPTTCPPSAIYDKAIPDEHAAENEDEDDIVEEIIIVENFTFPSVDVNIDKVQETLGKFPRTKALNSFFSLCAVACCELQQMSQPNS